MQGSLILKMSINVTQHINRIKGKNNMIFSEDEHTVGKIQYLHLLFKNLGIEKASLICKYVSSKKPTVKS